MPDLSTHWNVLRPLAGLRIKTKVWLTCLVPLLCLAGLSGIGYFAFGQIARTLDSYSYYIEAVGSTHDINRDLAVLWRNVAEFTLTGREDSAEQAKKTIAELRGKIDLGLTRIKDPASLARLREIATTFDAYVAGFNQVVRLKQEEIKLLFEVLDPIGEQIIDHFERLRAEALRAHTTSVVGVDLAIERLMQMRLWANKMLGRHDKEAFRRANLALDAVRKSLDAVDPALQAIAFQSSFVEMRTFVEAYAETYARGYQIIQELDTLLNGTMRTQAETISADADAIRAAVTADQHIADEAAHRLIVSTSASILAIALFALVLGLGLASLLGLSIASPMTQMANAMKRLANGDLDVEVHSIGRTDEIGTLAKSMIVFKENAILAKRLSREQASEQDAKVRRAERLQGLAHGFESRVGALAAALSDAAQAMNEAATTMSSTAEETKQQSGAVAEAAEQANTNVDTVARAAAELSTSLAKISNQVTQSMRLRRRRFMKLAEPIPSCKRSPPMRRRSAM
jgi:HAMP domain-containing protein